MSSKFSPTFTTIEMASKEVDKFYYKFDDDQKNMYSSIFEKNISFICSDSKSGAGKTTVALAAAINLVNQGIVDHIVYLRMVDQRNSRLGYLPGSLEEKEEKYFLPFYEVILNFGFRKEDIDHYSMDEDHQLFELTTDVSLRGRTLSNAVVIIDEAQNARFVDLKLALTRLDDSCKCFMIGQSSQRDNVSRHEEYAFERYCKHMSKAPWAKRCNLTKNHRGKMSTWADELTLRNSDWSTEYLNDHYEENDL